MCGSLQNSETLKTEIIKYLKQFIQEGRNIIVFVSVNTYAETLLELCIKHYLPAKLYIKNSKMTKHVEELMSPITITNYSKFGKAIDVPHKDTILFTMPVSKHQLKQITGRITRLNDNKKHPLVLHLVDTTNKIFENGFYGCRSMYKEMGITNVQRI
jgi:superfamily II DNA or RNA helicase